MRQSWKLLRNVPIFLFWKKKPPLFTNFSKKKKNLSIIKNIFYREKKLVVASDDYGRDLTGVQNLKKKHKRLEAELASHEPSIQAVQEAGEKLMDVSNLGVPEIEQVTWSDFNFTALVLRSWPKKGRKTVQLLLWNIIAEIEIIERSLVGIKGYGSY